jgi:hypothetical protein
VPADHNTRLTIWPLTHGVDSEFSGRGFGNIKGGLTIIDLPGGHEEMGIGSGLEIELVHQVRLGPARDFPLASIHDRTQEFAGAVI